MGNLEIILQEFKEMKGQFVITQSYKIERLIAISTDDYDYYYVTYDGRKITFNTCVGRIIQLKGRIKDDDYEDIVMMAKLNHGDQVIQDKKEHKSYKKDMLSSFIVPSEKLLTKVCWKLN